jgi:cation/acetate symporter
MPHLPRSHSINPRLGIYFGIVASLMVAAVVGLLLIEQLGAAPLTLRVSLFVLPLLLYAGLAAGSQSQDLIDFFAAGRRIPAFFSGLALGTTALGGVGVVALTGAVALMGMDAFALLIGWPAGLVFMAVLIVPYLRKFGAFTVPSYLGARVESSLVRVVAAACLAVPVLLILVAELRMAGFLAALLVPLPSGVLSMALALAVAALVATGGLRAVTWATAAQAMMLLLGLSVVLTTISILVATLPLPQMTAGNVLRAVGRLEVVRNLPLHAAAPLVVDLPSAGLEPLDKRFLVMFGQIGAPAFSGMILVVVAGIAGMPGLLARAGTTPGVSEGRRSMAWSVLILGYLILTLVAAAIFLRHALVDQVLGQAEARIPEWFQDLRAEGFTTFTLDQASKVQTLRVHRDGVLPALPMAYDLPAVLTWLLVAGALAAALAAVSVHLHALGASLAEDVVGIATGPATTDAMRVAAGRVGMAVAGGVAGVFSLVPADPLTLLLWALAFSAATSFPLLLLSVFSRRLNAWGTIAGLITGLVTTLVMIGAQISGMPGSGGPLPGLAGFIAAVMSATIVTRITPAVSRAALESLRDLRVPGGETIVDRQRRIQRQKSVHAG